MHPFLNRRDFLPHTATGLGGIALAHLLGRDRALAATPIRPAHQSCEPERAARAALQAARKTRAHDFLFRRGESGGHV